MLLVDKVVSKTFCPSKKTNAHSISETEKYDFQAERPLLCFAFALAIYTVVPSGIAIVDPAFRSNYAHITQLSLPVLIGSFSKSKQGALPKSKLNKRVDG